LRLNRCLPPSRRFRRRATHGHVQRITLLRKQPLFRRQWQQVLTGAAVTTYSHPATRLCHMKGVFFTTNGGYLCAVFGMTTSFSVIRTKSPVTISRLSRISALESATSRGATEAICG